MNSGGFIMTQNAENYHHIYFNDSIKVENELWFAAINVNGLYKMNCLTKEIEFCCFFPNANYDQTFLYLKMFRFENKLIFIPFQAKCISIYDMENKKMYFVQIPYTDNQDYSLFHTALQDKYIIYMIPCRYKKMVKFNLINNHIELIDVIVNHRKFQWNKECPLVIKGACKIKDYLYLGCYSANFIEKFAIRTGNIKYYDIPVDIGGISHLIPQEEKLWIIGNNGVICKWNELTGIEKVVEIKRRKEKLQAFWDVCLYEDILFLSGSTTYEIYLYHTKIGKLSIIPLGDESLFKEFQLFWANYPSMNRLFAETVSVLSALDGKLVNIDNLGRIVGTCEMKYKTKQDTVRYIFDQLDAVPVRIKNNRKVGSVIYHQLMNLS